MTATTAPTALADEFLTADQVAELLHTVRPRVWQMRCRGQLPPAIKVGGSILWDRAEFMTWLNTQKEK